MIIENGNGLRVIFPMQLSTNVIFSLVNDKGVCQKLNLAIGLIYSSPQKRCDKIAIYPILHHDCVRGQNRCDQLEAIIDSVSNKKPLSNRV